MSESPSRTLAPQVTDGAYVKELYRAFDEAVAKREAFPDWEQKQRPSKERKRVRLTVLFIAAEPLKFYRMLLSPS